MSNDKYKLSGAMNDIVTEAIRLGRLQQKKQMIDDWMEILDYLTRKGEEDRPHEEYLLLRDIADLVGSKVNKYLEQEEE